MDEDAGGTVLFVGTIRNQTDGKKVKGLEYEVYRRMAERQIARLEEEIRKRWPIKSITMVHREGKLKVGEVSVVVLYPRRTEMKHSKPLSTRSTESRIPFLSGNAKSSEEAIMDG